MKRTSIGIIAAGLLASANAMALNITLQQISTPFTTPIGIDYHEPTNSVIISANYPTGNPHNLERINQDGTHTSFSTLSGLTDELKIATVRSGNVGGFSTGEVFTGNGQDGQIVRISSDGTTVINPWVNLPGMGNGLLRGSLFVDRSGVYGGDLIAATTGGQIWRVNSAGAATFLADVNAHLEGLMSVPNDPIYGPIAGKIIAGAENQGLMYVFDDTGLVTSYNVGVNIEDIDLIEPNANFFGVNYGTGRILGATAAQFAPAVGKILLTQEFGGTSGLFTLAWNGSGFTTEAITLNAGSAPVGQWEHVTFAPAGIVEIPPTGIPEPAALSLLGAGLLGLGFSRRRKLKS